jgi:3-phenylpropionate/trans-cinnamate dioxygenase ferredoxin subunit
MNKTRHVICKSVDLPPGERKMVDVAGRSIGIFNVEGQLHAIKNRCPQGAELCRCTVGGTMLPAGPGEYEYGLEGRVLRCPWHFWEFDITTGKMLFVPGRMRVKTYQVNVEPPMLEKFNVKVEERMVVLYI